jgi:hypothetical protein
MQLPGWREVLQRRELGLCGARAMSFEDGLHERIGLRGWKMSRGAGHTRGYSSVRASS